MSILESFLAGKKARRTEDAAAQINAMQQYIGQNGQAIMGGDQNALGKLAGFGAEGLSMAMNVQGNVQDRQMRQEELAYTRDRRAVEDGREDQQWQMQVEEYKAGKTAAELAAEAAKIEEGVKMALAAPSPEAFDAMMGQLGMPDMVGQFENREMLAARYMSVADILKANEPPQPLSTPGKIAADVAAGLIPEGTEATPETVVNVGGEGDKFYETLDKTQAEMFNTLMTEGIQASRTMGLIDRLDGLMQESPTGAGAVFTRMAGEVGIDVGGLGEVQAVQALINQIVPQQRQPGSGPMSDADLALFKQSVPRLINTPEGNAIIVETMRGINTYVMEQAAIADAVANREITPAEARKRLKALTNPLDGFKGGGTVEAPPPATSPAAVPPASLSPEALKWLEE